jgi:polysaccharide export outer membrane protein
VAAPAAAADPAAKLGAPPSTDVDPSKMAAAAPSGVNPKPPNAAPVDSKSYLLGAEDVIFVAVWRSAEFSGQHMIRPDGKITINLVGEVDAAGLTPEQLGSVIREKLRKVLVEPDVSVSVTAVNSKRFFIEGEVAHPGEFKLVVPTRVLQALVNAGGFRDFANQKKITVMRGTKRFYFNYKAVIAGKNQDENIYLEPDDIIIVK